LCLLLAYTFFSYPSFEHLIIQTEEAPIIIAIHPYVKKIESYIEEEVAFGFKDSSSSLTREHQTVTIVVELTTIASIKFVVMVVQTPSSSSLEDLAAYFMDSLKLNFFAMELSSFTGYFYCHRKG